MSFTKTIKPAPPVSDLSQVPYLLKLMDDASPTVREKVASRLRELGPAVWPEVARLQLELAPYQYAMLKAILAVTPMPSVRPVENWLDWLSLPTENEKLEAAYGWLSRHRWGPVKGAGVHEALNALANEYLMTVGTPDPEELSNFLFDTKKLKGVAQDHFYESGNSDLMTVIGTGRGIPISLVSIFILVGWRLDLHIVGCNFPGHFLARAPLAHMPLSFSDGFETDLVFDCHRGPGALRAFEVAALRKTAPSELQSAASAATIMSRVLNNLATAHHIILERERTIFYLNLRSQLEDALHNQNPGRNRNPSHPSP